MFKKNIFYFLLPGVFVALPVLVFAQETAVVNYTLFPDVVENLLELVNLVLALLIGTYAIKLAALSQGGVMEKTWNMFAVAAVAFAILEVNNALAGFGLVHIGGLDEIIEAFFAVTLLVTVIKTRRFLLKQVLGK